MLQSVQGPLYTEPLPTAIVYLSATVLMLRISIADPFSISSPVWTVLSKPWPLDGDG